MNANSKHLTGLSKQKTPRLFHSTIFFYFHCQVSHCHATHRQSLLLFSIFRVMHCVPSIIHVWIFSFTVTEVKCVWIIRCALHWGSRGTDGYQRQGEGVFHEPCKSAWQVNSSHWPQKVSFFLQILGRKIDSSLRYQWLEKAGCFCLMRMSYWRFSDDLVLQTNL